MWPGRTPYRYGARERPPLADAIFSVPLQVCLDLRTQLTVTDSPALAQQPRLGQHTRVRVLHEVFGILA